MHGARQATTLAFLVLAVGACSSDSTAGVDGAVDAALGVTPAKACDDQANAVCALRDSCAPGFGIAHNYGAIALCQKRTAQICVNALDARGTGSSPATVESCAAAYPGEKCSDFFDSNPVAACVPPMGTVAMGAACGAAAQCVTGYCAIAQYAVCGTCQPQPAIGADCQVQAECGRDLACVTVTAGGVTTSKCAAWVLVGGACLTGYQPCANGLACVGDVPATSKTGICMTQPTTLGAACDAGRNTAPNCNGSFGSVCIPSAKGSSVGTCQSITLVGPGATCGTMGSMPITGLADCAAGGLCKKAVSTDATGVCVAPAADGAACDNDPANGPPCLLPAKCVVPVGSPGTAGLCTVPNASTCS